MPKVRLTMKKPPVKADPIGDLIRRYKKDRRVSNERLSAELGISRSGYDYRMARSPGCWTMDTLRQLGNVLDIPATEMSEAVREYLGR